MSHSLHLPLVAQREKSFKKSEMLLFCCCVFMNNALGTGKVSWESGGHTLCDWRKGSVHWQCTDQRVCEFGRTGLQSS